MATEIFASSEDAAVKGIVVAGREAAGMAGMG